MLYDAGNDEITVINNKKYSDTVKMILLSNIAVSTTASTLRNVSSTTLTQPSTKISSTTILQTGETTKKKPLSNFTEGLMSLNKVFL